MAELYVERKKKSPVLWVIVALVLLAVIGWVLWTYYLDRNSAADPAPAQTTTPSPAQPAPY